MPVKNESVKVTKRENQEKGEKNVTLLFLSGKNILLPSIAFVMAHIYYWGVGSAAHF